MADLQVFVAQLSLIYDDVDEEEFAVRTINIHPAYVISTLQNNIALIEVFHFNF